MCELRVTKVDDVHVRVDCEDRGVLYELNDYFSFYVPNYQFMPQYKNKMWDGKIRLFNTFMQTLYVGLLTQLTTFAENRDYAIEYIGFDKIGHDLSVDDVRGYFQELSPTSDGQRLTPRDYQVEGLQHALNNERCLLLSPTSSGKSLLIYGLVRYLLENDENDESKVLIIVPTKGLVEQMYNDFLDYSSEDEWDAESNVHTIYSGKEKDTQKDIIISTWQSIYKKPKSYFSQFKVCIGDEAHGFKSKSLKTLMEKLTECPYRVGLTGTVQDAESHRLVLEGVFGPLHELTTSKKLIEKGQMSDIDISCLMVNYADADRKAAARKSYQDEIDFIVSHSERNKLIRNLACKLTGNTLVLYQYVDKHGKPLYEMIEGKTASSEKDAFLIHGQVPVHERESIRSRAEKQNNMIIVASYGTFSTGINIKNLHNIVFASPYKSKIKILQSIGRGLRKAKGKDKMYLFDIVDDLRWKKWKNYTIKHFKKRVELYNRNQFKYRMKKLNISERG